jgi:hypothetical protein
MSDINLTARRVRLALLLVLLSLPQFVLGATRGPDAGGYTATDATVYSFVDLVGAGGAASILAGTDDGTAVLTLPFAFRFYGVDYTQVCVSSNGAIYFITTPGACAGINDFANVDLSSTMPPGDLPALYPFWSDLTFQVAGGGAVYYQTTGAPGARRFVIQWEKAYPQDSANPVTFQAILTEGSNSVVFQYKEVDLGSGNPATRGADATVGIRSVGAPSNMRQILWSFDAQVIANESALLFAPSAAVPPAVTVTGGTFVYDGNPHPATAVATGTGGAPVSGSFAFSYTPPGGPSAPVNAGSYTVLATFTSADPGFSNATGTASITIDKATPVITWASPAPISEGTPLGAAQLNATVNAPGTLTYTPPAGTLLNDGVATLTASFTPANPANYNAATKSVSLTVRPTAGEMEGEGRTDVAGLRYEFQFHLNERASGAERGWITLEVERIGRETRANQIGTFASFNVDTIVFSDNPAFRPGYSPKPNIDSASISGTGRWNGMPGYTFSGEVVDAGEPGAGRDRFTMTVRSPQGATVATVTGTITAGNIQSSRVDR